jgi:hypothetical protein
VAPLDLSDSWTKVERAREHTDALESLAEAFIKRRPNQVFFDKHAKPPWVLLSVAVEPAPKRLSVIAGDLIQNLRSALDHAVWQIVLRHGQKPGKHTCFPIYRSKSQFEKRVRNPPKDRLGPLHGIDHSADEWTLIEAVQPYHAPDPVVDPLAVIAALSNADKHRTLLAGLSLVHDFDITDLTDITGLDVIEFRATAKADDLLTNNAEIARFLPSTPGRMQMKRDLPFEIAISDGDTTTPEDIDFVVVPLRQFDQLRSHIVRILGTFEQIARL